MRTRTVSVTVGLTQHGTTPRGRQCGKRDLPPAFPLVTCDTLPLLHDGPRDPARTVLTLFCKAEESRKRQPMNQKADVVLLSATSFMVHFRSGLMRGSSRVSGRRAASYDGLNLHPKPNHKHNGRCKSRAERRSENDHAPSSTQRNRARAVALIGEGCARVGDGVHHCTRADGQEGVWSWYNA